MNRNHFLKQVMKQIVHRLLKVGRIRFAALIMIIAIIVSVVLVLTIDFLWDGRFNAELEFAGVITPFLDGLFIIIFFTAMLDEIRAEVERRKAAEDDIRALNEKLEKDSQELESKVRERTAELEEKTIQADAATRAKAEFLSNMSHELKTPLNAIIGFSEILKNGAVGTLTAQQKEYLTDIWESGSHLNRITNDILEMMTVKEKKADLAISDFPLKEMVEEALGRFSEKAKKQGVRLGVELPDNIGHMIADRGNILMVLQNLLGNAIKFTPEGGSVRVSARRIADFGLQISDLGKEEGLSAVGVDEVFQSAIRNPQSAIEFAVTDTGIGIANEDIGRLFRPFQQLSPALTKKYEGIGLGLSICRKNVGLHGGKIWVESEAGKGSKFIFTIPVR